MSSTPWRVPPYRCLSSLWTGLLICHTYHRSSADSNLPPDLDAAGWLLITWDYVYLPKEDKHSLQHCHWFSSEHFICVWSSSVDSLSCLLSVSPTRIWISEGRNFLFFTVSQESRPGPAAAEAQHWTSMETRASLMSESCLPKQTVTWGQGLGLTFLGALHM